ncbi:Protein of unknown function, partial [Gryllus bimaculatus]
MRRLAGWRADWCEPNWDALWAAVGCAQRLQRPGRPLPSVKKRRVLVRNLLASGYDLPTLHADWQRGGHALVLRRVTRMKNLRESYITDTRSLTAHENNNNNKQQLMLPDRELLEAACVSDVASPQSGPPDRTQNANMNNLYCCLGKYHGLVLPSPENYL